MKRDNTVLFDWALQAAALMAVLFVFHAGVARGAMPADRERDVIAEALHAGVSPSLALAVATVDAGSNRWRTRAGIRSAIARLRDATTRYPARLDRAMAQYGGRADGTGFAAAVRIWARRFDADARATARALAARPSRHRPRLDDFDDTIALRARRAGRTLDDFPYRARKG
jgi:hypothetical protein